MSRPFVIVLLLVGCGASSSRVVGPDGSNDWYSITCRRNMSNCLERAGEVCPSGYDTAAEREREGYAAQVNTYGGTLTPTYRGELLIKCRD